MRNHLCKIRNKFNTFLLDERGGAITVLLLFLLPLLMFMFISRVEETRILRATNETLEKAVEESAKSAAMMVDPESQAKGNPLISHNRAIEMLEEQLKASLGLDNDFKGSITTSLDEVRYWAVVFNGVDNYGGYKYEDYIREYYAKSEVAYLKYFTSHGSEEEIKVPESTKDTFVTFYVNNENGISYVPSKGAIKVTMDRPGVLLVVQGRVNPVIVSGNDSNREVVTRWAYAKVVKR